MKILLALVICHVITISRGDKRALLIVDIQDCFLSNGSLTVSGGEEVIPVINKIRNEYEDEFSLVVLSQDWHCPDHVSFASQHPGHNTFENVVLPYDEQGNLCYGRSVSNSFPHARPCDNVAFNITQRLWPDHCIKNVTAGPTSSQLSEELTQKGSDYIIQKGGNCEVDSYSLFSDNGGFRSTHFHGVLKKHDIDTVYISGLALDYCVYFTALDAVKLGYETYAIEDACRGVAPDTTKAALADLREKGVHVIQSSTLNSYLVSGSRKHLAGALPLLLLALFLFL